MPETAARHLAGFSGSGRSSWPSWVRGKTGGKYYLILVCAGGLAVALGFLAPLITGESQANRSAFGEPAPADNKGLAYSPPAKPDSFDAGAALTRISIGTMVVLALCVATLCLFKSRLPAGRVLDRGGHQLEVVETLSLDRRSSLFLIKAGNQQVLAAVDATGLKSLLALPEAFNAALGEAQVRDLDSAVATQGMVVPIGPHLRPSRDL